MQILWRTLLGKHEHGREDNIKVDLRERGCGLGSTGSG